MGELLRLSMLIGSIGMLNAEEIPARKCSAKERCTRLEAPFSTLCFPKIRQVKVGRQENGPHDSGRTFTAQMSGANAQVVHGTGHLIGGDQPSESAIRDAVSFSKIHYRNDHADRIIDKRWTTAAGLRSRLLSRAFEYARYENVPPAHAALLDKLLDGFCTVPMAASLQ